MQSGVDFDAVLPAVLQCFTIIGSGYIARRFNVIGADDTKGIRMLIVYFLMPMMIAQAILTIQWEKVNWRFIACVFIAKALVFVAVAAVTLALSNDLAKAGMYGIFVSQSNDMAFGCPLIKALYKSTHPEYLDYVYLLMPISLLILNPVAFLMMEIEGQRKIARFDHQRPLEPADRSHCLLLRRVVCGIAKNPMIISTVIGLIGSVCLGRHRLPSLLNTVLDGFSSGFVTVALFALGCTLLNNGKPDAHYPLGTALLLSLAKILLLPLILRELVSFTNIGRTESDSTSLSVFGFLYGSLPTAPTVFVFACHYNVAVKQISTALALVTLLSAPWVYLSSKMISISHIDKAEYNAVYSVTEINTAIIGIITAIVCIAIYVTTRRIRRVPHVIVFYILISSLIACTGVLLGLTDEDQDRYIWRRMTVRTLILWGQLSLRLFAVMLAVVMTLLRSVGLCLVLRLRTPSVAVGFCFSFFVALSVVLSAEVANTSGVSKNDFETISAYVTAVVVTLCLIANVLLLICQYKCGALSMGCVHHSTTDTGAADRPAGHFEPGPLPARRADAAYVNEVPDIEDAVIRRPTGESCDESNGVDAVETCGDKNAMDNLRLLEPHVGQEPEDGPSTSGVVRPMCPSRAPCSSEQRHKCKRLLRRYMKKTSPSASQSLLTEPLPADEPGPDLISGPETDLYEIMKHSFLVAFLCISMTVSLFVALWRSVRRELDCGTYVQLQILNTVLLYGQPAVILVLFGSIGSWIMGLRRRFRRLFYGSEKLVLPSPENIDEPTKAVCEQFTSYHLSQCGREIAKTVRSTLSVQENVFRGADLIDWLLKRGIADGRASAVKYGRRLVLGRVIEHIEQEEHFYDSAELFYRFVSQQSPSRQLPFHAC